MKKNDRVRLRIETTLPWCSDRKVPAGAEGLVYKVSRNGMIRVGFKETHGSALVLPEENLEVLPRQVTMPKVGDLFYAAWGFGQTNIDFYQVTAVKGKMIEVTPIAETRKYDQPMAGHTVPVPNKFTGETRRVMVRFNDRDEPYFKVSSYATAFPAVAGQEYFFSEWN